jgi:hypothetical protein
MNGIFMQFRSLRTGIIAFFVAFLCFSPLLLRAHESKPTRTVWEKKLTEEVLRDGSIRERLISLTIAS